MERKGLTGVFWSWQKVLLLVVLLLYCQFRFHGLSRWKKSQFKIIMETWNKEFRDQDGRTPCQRSIGNVWGTLSSWLGNNLIQTGRPCRYTELTARSWILDRSLWTGWRNDPFKILFLKNCRTAPASVAVIYNQMFNGEKVFVLHSYQLPFRWPWLSAGSK